MGGARPLNKPPHPFFLKRESFLLCNKIRRNIKIYSHLLWSTVQVIERSVCPKFVLFSLFISLSVCPKVNGQDWRSNHRLWARVTYGHRESLIEHSVPVHRHKRFFFFVLNRENNIQDKFGFYCRACSIFSAHYRPVPYTNSLS